MIGWKVFEYGKIQQADNKEMLTGVDSVKVRLTHALVTDDDVALIAGENKNMSLPLIPCRMAIGKVSEIVQKTDTYDKGSRVFVAPIKSCGQCQNCADGKEDACYNFSIAGKNSEGFLKDFAVLDAPNVYPIPSKVSDSDAIFIEYIAMASSVINKLNAKRGRHVLIIGANTFGVIIAQVALYHQLIPIIIDNNETNLKKARKTGIPNTFMIDAKLEKEISNVTGNNWVNGVVYVNRSGLNVDLAYKFIAPGHTVAFAGYSYPPIKVSLNGAMQNQSHTVCVTNGYGNYEEAIQLLDDNAFDLNEYKLSPIKTPAIVDSILEQVDNFNKKQPVKNILVDLLN